MAERLAPWQHAALQVPEEHSIMCAGGRGGGKTTFLLLATVRHCEMHQENARPLIVRESHPALLELSDKLDELLAAAYGQRVQRNKAEKTWRLPNGAVIEVGQVDGPQAVKKFQGRSFTMLGVDEFGAFREKRWVDQLKASLRAPAGIPLRTIATANPGGSLHTVIHKGWICAAPAWQPFNLDGETWVTIPTTLDDNPFLDHDDYRRRLRSACSGDDALLKAWESGDWNISRGSYFGDVWDESVHVAPPFPFPLKPEWMPFLSLDWGSSAPSVVLLCAIAPDNRKWPTRSLIVVDEVATYDPTDPTMNTGLRWPVSKLAEEVRESLAKKYAVHPAGVGDDAAGIEGRSLLEALQQHGIYLQLGNKERVAGWQRIRQRLANAAGKSGPGLYVTSRCRYTLETLPFLERDPRRPEDLLTTGPDHAADALRMAVAHADLACRSSSGTTIGLTY